MDAKRETVSSSSAEMKLEKDVVILEEDEDTFKNEDVLKPRIILAEKMPSHKQDNSDNIRKEDDELESTKAEMGEVKKENQRLKKMLERIENDYKSLQTRLSVMVQSEQEHKKSPPVETEAHPNHEAEKEDQEPDISLCLGLQTRNKRKKDESNTSVISTPRLDANKLMSEGLSLGLESTSPPPSINLSDKGSERSGEAIDSDAKEDCTRETWPPSKALKTKDSASEEETSQLNNTKRARVSVRARCDTPTMNDGCQWRKYGQKIAKGNPCPRAYYRCTVAPSCPVGKQVQRCSNDMSILITTYEGTHNHSLPVAATSMASTTSAAASILLSGSSTSRESLTSAAPMTMTATNLNGMKFTLYNNSKTNQFSLPSSCSPNTPPTITLDLTSNPSSLFNKRHASDSFLHSSSDYSSRSLDFSSYNSEPKSTYPIGWSNNSYLNYSLLPSNKTPLGSISFEKSTFEQRNHPNTSISSSSSSSQQYLTETLTKVLTSDPSFQSAVAAAISSMVGSSANNSLITSNMNRTNSGGLTQNLQWSDQGQGIKANSLLHNNGKGCAPTFLNKPTSSASSNPQTAANFMLLQSPFPFSRSKSSSSPDLKD